jgi:hypothetical protein
VRATLHTALQRLVTLAAGGLSANDAAQFASRLLQQACTSIAVLERVVPNAVRHQVPAVLDALSRPMPTNVPADLTTAAAELLTTLVQRFALGNQLLALLESVQKTLLGAAPEGDGAASGGTLLTHLLNDGDAGSTAAVGQDEVEASHGGSGRAAFVAAIARGAETALDVEGIVGFVRDAAAAAIAVEGDDDDDDDDDVKDSPTAAAVAVPFQRRAAVVALCRFVLRGVAPSALNGLAALETLVELDVQVAAHTGANVLTRVAVADTTVATAAAAYDAKPRSKALQAWADASLRASEERQCAAQWLLLLSAIRSTCAKCAQELGVSAPESFLSAMEEAVWQYGSDLGTIVAAFDATEVSALLAYPTTIDGASESDEATAMPEFPSLGDITNAEIRSTVDEAQRLKARVEATVAATVTALAAQRVTYALGVLSALGAQATEDEPLWHAQASAAVDAKAAKILAKQVHFGVLALLQSSSAGRNSSAEHRALAIYTPAAALTCSRFHPSGAAHVAEAVARLSTTGISLALRHQLNAVRSALTAPLTAWLVATADEVVEATKRLIASAKKQLWAKAVTRADNHGAAGEDLTSAIADADLVSGASRAVAALLASLHERGSLPQSDVVATVVGDLHRRVLEVCLGRLDRLGLAAHPGSALAATVALLSNARLLAAAYLRLLPRMTEPTLAAFLRAPEGQPAAWILEAAITTVSVDPEGSAAFVAACWEALCAAHGRRRAVTSATPDSITPLPTTGNRKRDRPRDEAVTSLAEAFDAAARSAMLTAVMEALSGAIQSCPFVTAGATERPKLDRGSMRLLTLVGRLAALPSLLPLASRGPATAAASAHRREGQALATDAAPAPLNDLGDNDLHSAFVAWVDSAMDLCSRTISRAFALEISAEHYAVESIASEGVVGHVERAAATMRLLLVHALPADAATGKQRHTTPLGSKLTAAIRHVASDVASTTLATVDGSMTLLNALLSPPAGLVTCGAAGNKAAAQCIAAAWALAAATGSHPPHRQNGAATADAALLVPADAEAAALFVHAAACMTDATSSFTAAALTAASSATAAMAHALLSIPLVALRPLQGRGGTSTMACQHQPFTVQAASSGLQALLRLPFVKVKPLKPSMESLLATALRSSSLTELTSALDLCRANVRSLHKDPGFVDLELSVVTHVLSLNIAAMPRHAAAASAGAALSAASRLLVMLTTSYIDSLQKQMPLLVTIARLLVRFTLAGLKHEALTDTAASLLGATLFHLSRATVLSGLGRRAGSSVASAMSLAIFDEMRLYPDVVARHSLQLDLCGADVVNAATERHEVVFGLLRHSPQAQALFRKAVTRIDEAKLDAVAVDAGHAVPSAGSVGPVAFA